MQSGAKTYEKIARTSVSRRALEADLLLKAASRLQAVRDSWESRRGDLNEALHYNRKLWTLFLSEVTSAANPLPADIRQNVANIGLFVVKQTLAVLSNPQPKQLNSLISINRELAAGLRDAA
ncbi:MAG TPA: flagellar biosynthesis regulator FlaF [Pseudolabrys sp.]|nr:flagellar biosynthesis regulator FlaF [Pseudolabrys sp.]